MPKQIATEKTVAVTYTKEQLIGSDLFAKRRDLLSALLKDNERYSIEDASRIIENFMKGKVV